MKKWLVAVFLIPAFAGADTLLLENANIGSDWFNVGVDCYTQVFPVSDHAEITRIQVYISRILATDWTLSLMSTAESAPDTVLTSKTVGDPGGTNQWLEFAFDTPYEVTPGNYGAKLDISEGSGGGPWNASNGNQYTGTFYKQGSCTGSWTEWGTDDWPIRVYGNLISDETTLWIGSATTSATSTEEILTAGFLALVFGISLIIFLVSLFAAGYFYNTIIKPFYDGR